MQSPSWYINRLKSMSISEIVWRVESFLVSYIEQFRIITGLLPDASAVSKTGLCGVKRGFSLLDNEHNKSHFETKGVLHHSSLHTLQYADEIIKHRLTYFNHQLVNIGEPINWHYDHNRRISSPRRLSAYIDYRSVTTSGDCKEVWEPNRHHQLVVLARAYVISGDEKYATEVYQQIEHWLKENPYGTGMNWRSPLELAIRMINWVFALDLIKDSKASDDADIEMILHALYLHLWDVSRKFSKGSSANNHLVGEAAGVFIMASWLPTVKNASRLIAESKKILCEEIERQTYADGCTKEQALGYEFFVLQFYIVCGLVGRWTNNEFPVEYWARVKVMLGFVADLAEAGTQFPMFGDRDDGYVLNLGDKPDNIDMLLNIGAILFDSTRFKNQCQGFTETAYWLFGDEGLQYYESLSGTGEKTELSSHAYTDAGYYLLQSGLRHSPDCISLLFDCAELGYGSIAAHGHADALSIMLRVGSTDVLVDPGTYDYFTYPEWRKYFRSTAAHNTIEVDDQNQSELLGSFLWGKRANATCIDWVPTASGGKIVARHDGYSRLPDPLIHQRTVFLEGDSSTINITDDIIANQSHQVKLYFHLSEHCSIERVVGQGCSVLVAGKIISFRFSEGGQLEIINGQEEPICGWLSRSYHQKQPINTLVITYTTTGNASLETRIRIE